MTPHSISRNWLFSKNAQRVYLVCAILDLAFLGTRVGITAAMSVAGVLTLPTTMRMVVGLLSVPEVMGIAVLTVGMTYCWIDRAARAVENWCGSLWS